MTNVDDMINCFNSSTLRLLDKHAPLKPKINKMHDSNVIWFTPEIRREILERNIARRFSRRSGLELDRRTYYNLRNKVISLI